MISKMHQSLDVRIFRLLRQVISCKQGLDRIKDFPDALPSLCRVNSADQTEGEDYPGQVVRVASKTFQTFHQSKYKTDKSYTLKCKCSSSLISQSYLVTKLLLTHRKSLHLPSSRRLLVISSRRSLLVSFSPASLIKFLTNSSALMELAL